MRLRTMKRRIIFHLIMIAFGVFCAVVGWYAEERFELKLKRGMYDDQIAFLTDLKRVLLARKNIPDEMYYAGVLLYSQRWYSEADQILRFIAARGGEDDKWSVWKRGAQDLLLQDDFQALYEKGIVRNTFDIRMNLDALGDKESVRRKYGQPDEIISITTKGQFPDEQWFYYHEHSQTNRFYFMNFRGLYKLYTTPFI